MESGVLFIAYEQSYPRQWLKVYPFNNFFINDKTPRSKSERHAIVFILSVYRNLDPWLMFFCQGQAPDAILSGLYLISTVPLQKPRFYAVSRACFCRYLSEYSDNSRFSCMLTFWTYLMRCTYPWHWIKYSTKYNRCHLIFSLSW